MSKVGYFTAKSNTQNHIFSTVWAILFSYCTWYYVTCDSIPPLCNATVAAV